MSNWCPACCCSFFVLQRLLRRCVFYYCTMLHDCVLFCWATQVRVRLATRLARCPERQTRVRIVARSLAARRAEPLWTAAAAVRSSLAASSIPTTSARASAAPTRTCCGYWFSCVNIKSYRSHLSRNSGSLLCVYMYDVATLLQQRTGFYTLHYSTNVKVRPC